jgi:hypothetical protein
MLHTWGHGCKMILVIGLHSNIVMMWVDLRDECHDINWTWVQGMQCGRFGMLWRRRKMRKKKIVFMCTKSFFCNKSSNHVQKHFHTYHLGGGKMFKLNPKS